MLIEDIIEVVCDGCDDNFCKKNGTDLIECIRRYKESWDMEH